MLSALYGLVRKENISEHEARPQYIEMHCHALMEDYPSKGKLRSACVTVMLTLVLPHDPSQFITADRLSSQMKC